MILCDTMPSAIAVSVLSSEREKKRQDFWHIHGGAAVAVRIGRAGGKSSQSQIMVRVCSKMPRRGRTANERTRRRTVPAGAFTLR